MKPTGSPQTPGLRARPRCGEVLLIAALLLPGTLLPRWAWAQAGDAPTVQSLKAAFLYNFAKFTEWPEEKLPAQGAPFVIGVVSDASFVKTLEEGVEGRTIGGHSIVVRDLRDGEDPSGCHLVYLASENAASASLLPILSGLGVLAVGESSDFLERGGVIRIYPESGRLRFEISVPNALGARLRVSSRLLALAARVEREGGAGS